MKMLPVVAPTKDISILLPTRGRNQVAKHSLESLVKHASGHCSIEYLVALDRDDADGIAYFRDHVVPEFTAAGCDITVFATANYGYQQLHRYLNFLGQHSCGSWLIFWNDDAIMLDHNWDQEIVSYTDQFKLLAFTDNHNGHPYSIFPIIPRDWMLLLDNVSEHQQTDAWTSQLAYLTDCFQRIKTRVLHDRADLTGNNNDQTFQNRVYYEGNTENPDDINSLETNTKRYKHAAKISWFLKKIGQDTGWFDRVLSIEQDPWAKMFDDPRSLAHLNKFNIVNEQ